jgi:hypothetical protein
VSKQVLRMTRDKRIGCECVSKWVVVLRMTRDKRIGCECVSKWVVVLRMTRDKRIGCECLNKCSMNLRKLLIINRLKVETHQATTWPPKRAFKN